MKMATLWEFGKASRVALQVIVVGNCLEVETLCENKDSAAQTRPALDKGTTCSRIPLGGKGRMAVSVN